MPLIAASGANPMIAYAGLANFVAPIVGLTGAASLIDAWNPSPWTGALIGVGWMLIAWAATARGLFWRT